MHMANLCKTFNPIFQLFHVVNIENICTNYKNSGLMVRFLLFLEFGYCTTEMSQQKQNSSQVMNGICNTEVS